MDAEILGIAACDHCNRRFRVRKQNSQMVGKTVQCPKCHRPFTLKIEPPTALETAAIKVDEHQSPSDDSATTRAPAKRTRRKKEQIREEICKQIRTEMRPLIRRLKAIVDDPESPEEKVRQWCVDVFRSALGYTDADLDFEATAMGQRIDIAVKIDGTLMMIVECKNPRAKIDAARVQAANYAIKKSVDWAVTTTGQVWKLFCVVPVKGNDPKTVEVFDVALFDDDGLSKADVENLYLLSRRALVNGDTDSAYHQRESLSTERVVAALKSPQVLKSLKKVLSDDYKAESGTSPKIDESLVSIKLDELYLPESF